MLWFIQVIQKVTWREKLEIKHLTYNPVKNKFMEEFQIGFLKAVTSLKGGDGKNTEKKPKEKSLQILNQVMPQFFSFLKKKCFYLHWIQDNTCTTHKATVVLK